MSGQVDQAAGERTGFRACALVIGSMYASVTLLVAGIALLRVTTADAQLISGYATPAPVPVSVVATPAPLVGDFWPGGAGLSLRSASSAS